MAKFGTRNGCVLHQKNGCVLHRNWWFLTVFCTRNWWFLTVFCTQKWLFCTQKWLYFAPRNGCIWLQMGVLVENVSFLTHFGPFFDHFWTRIFRSGVLFSEHPCIYGRMVRTENWHQKACIWTSILGQKNGHF